MALKGWQSRIIIFRALLRAPKHGPVSRLAAREEFAALGYPTTAADLYQLCEVPEHENAAKSMSALLKSFRR